MEWTPLIGSEFSDWGLWVLFLSYPKVQKIQLEQKPGKYKENLLPACTKRKPESFTMMFFQSGKNKLIIL
jgi:hypothetical protein